MNFIQKNSIVLLLLLNVVHFVKAENVDTTDGISITNKYILAKNSYLKNDFYQTENLCKEYIKENPIGLHIKDCTFYLAEINRKQKLYLQAIKYYTILQEKFPHSKYKNVLHYSLGYSYYKLYIYNRAEKEFLYFLKLPKISFSKKVNSHLFLARMYKYKKQYKKAIHYYQKSSFILELKLKQNKKIDKSQKNSTAYKLLQEIYRELGFIYSKKLKDKETAYFYLNKSVKMGTQYSSSLKFALRELSFEHYSKGHGLKDSNIADIKIDGDDVWIATWGAGLYRYSRSTEKFKFISLPSSQLRSLYIDFDNIYINTYDGIYILNKTTYLVKSLSLNKTIFSLAQKIIKDDKYLYFSTLTKGVIRYNIFTKEITIFGYSSFLKTNQVYSMTANEKYIVFGTLSKGAVILDKEKKEITYINKKSKLIQGNNIKTLLLDGRYLWLGVHRFGIYRYDLELHKIKKFHWKMRYPTALAKRDKEIWIGSFNHGIKVYNRETGKVERIRAIEGLTSNQVNIIEIEDNYIWIGYIENGIDILYRPLNLITDE